MSEDTKKEVTEALLAHLDWALNPQYEQMGDVEVDDTPSGQQEGVEGDCFHIRSCRQAGDTKLELVMGSDAGQVLVYTISINVQED